MSYTIISSERSPFGRVCRMYMHTHKLPFEFKILNFVNDPAAAAALAQETPINRLPILIDDGQKIFDSRVIINHLAKKHGLPSLSLEEENRVSAIYSVIDTSVILFLMRNDKFDVDGPQNFLARNRERIPNGINYVTEWASGLDPKNPADWNYPSMSLYACLEWGERRAKTLRISDHPRLADFMKRFAGAPGVAETSFAD